MQNCLTMSILAQNIRRLMADKGLKQQDLAKATGILRPNISRLLTNPNANPQLSIIESIATALDVSVCELFEESSKKLTC
jgi:transcriptional regulator with XRE-family HTH domain